MDNYRVLISNIKNKFDRLKENDVNEKPNGKWSKKEILGHLCDSAINNIYRFMELQRAGKVYEVISYDQDLWVEQASYGNRPWNDLCQLWYSLNINILNILEFLSKRKDLNVSIDGKIYTSDFLVEDYFSHLKHHANQISSNEK